MPDSFPVPAADSHFDDRGDVLRVTGGPTQPTLEFRVDDGLVFVRFISAARQLTPATSLTPAGGMSTNPSRQWHQASAETVFSLFSDDSSVATWLRSRGVNLIRLALLDIGGEESARREES
ncbi:MAG: hypothetical protein ABJE47_10290 [bacterium]